MCVVVCAASYLSVILRECLSGDIQDEHDLYRSGNGELCYNVFGALTHGYG